MYRGLCGPQHLCMERVQSLTFGMTDVLLGCCGQAPCRAGCAGMSCVPSEERYEGACLWPEYGGGKGCWSGGLEVIWGAYSRTRRQMEGDAAGVRPGPEWGSPEGVEQRERGKGSPPLPKSGCSHREQEACHQMRHLGHQQEQKWPLRAPEWTRAAWGLGYVEDPGLLRQSAPPLPRL